MELKHVTFLFFASVGACLSAKAQPDYKVQFIKKELATARTIVILNNDIDPNMEKANPQLDEAMKKFWSATKVEFINKKYSEARQSKDNEIYIGLVREINNGLYENKGSEGLAEYYLTFLRRDKGKLVADVSCPDIHLYRNFSQLDIITGVRILS